MEKSLVSQVLFQTALPPSDYTGSADGASIDSQDFQSLTLMVHCYAFTGDCVLKLQESVDNVTFTDVSSDDILYPESLAVKATGIGQLGYIGKARYVRAVFVSGTASLAVYATKGHPTRVPTVGPLADKQFPV